MKLFRHLQRQPDGLAVARAEGEGGAMRGFVIVVLALAVASPAVGGPRWFVAANGTDSAMCGSKKEPCRTITVAMANASDGDTVEVGPGRYGDLNANGVLGEAEEEAPVGCGCAILLTKSLLLQSRGGAAVTVIEAGGAAFGVQMDSTDGVLGRPGRGFTIRGAGTTGVEVRGTTNEVAGNLVIENVSSGITVSSVDTVLVGNTAVGNSVAGIFIQSGFNSILIGNRSYGSQTGFLVLDGGSHLWGNVASGNSDNGFHLSGSGHYFEKNAANGNGGVGLFVQNAASAESIVGNSFVGNGGAGLWLIGPVTEISRNNIYGNDPSGNCGVLNQTDTAVEMTKNFWGAASGPGVNPADDVCNMGTSSTTVGPAAKKPFKLKLKPPK